MDAKEEIFRILRKHQALLVRSKKHHLYKLPNGKIFVTGITPTDERGWRNRLAQLRKLLSIVPPDNGAAPTKRRLATAIGRRVPEKVLLADTTETLPALRSLAEQLKEITAANLPRQLWNCHDILSGPVCALAGLSQGSTYAQLVRHLRREINASSGCSEVDSDKTTDTPA